MTSKKLGRSLGILWWPGKNVDHRRRSMRCRPLMVLGSKVRTRGVEMQHRSRDPVNRDKDLIQPLSSRKPNPISKNLNVKKNIADITHPSLPPPRGGDFRL